MRSDVQPLVLRGAQSDLLSKNTADEMAARGPRPQVMEFAGIAMRRCCWFPIKSIRSSRSLRGGAAASSGPVR